MLLVSIETPEEDQAISDTWGLGNSPCYYNKWRHNSENLKKKK